MMNIFLVKFYQHLKFLLLISLAIILVEILKKKKHHDVKPNAFIVSSRTENNPYVRTQYYI